MSREAVGEASFRVISPFGRVPAVEFDDGETLFDSTAIVLALADRFPETGLIGPLGSADRERAYAWCLSAMTELERAAIAVLHGGGESPRELWQSASGAFAEAVDGRGFLVGDRLGVADIVLAGVLLVGERAGLLGEGADVRLTGYLGALRARPAFARALVRTESTFR